MFEQILSVWDASARQTGTGNTEAQELVPQEFARIGLDGELRHLSLGPDAGTRVTTDGEGRVYFLRLVIPGP